MEKLWTVKELAHLSGVSVRALHYYDEIGLLTPQARTDSGYRLYGDAQLLRLQQILFYKELEVPLKEIARLLLDPRFDSIQVLHTHRNVLIKRKRKLGKLIHTLDQTLRTLKGETMINESELYEGFSPEQIQRYEQEIEANYDPVLVAESKKRIQDMSSAQWKQIQSEGDHITAQLALLLCSKASRQSEEVQVQVKRHHCWIEHYYPASKEVYLGLAQLYLENEEFRQHYEQYQAGLAQFLSDAMKIYATNNLT